MRPPGQSRSRGAFFNRLMSIAASSRAAIAEQLGLSITGIIITVTVARVLGPAEQGLFTLALSFATILALIFHGSIGIAVTNISSRNPETRPALIGNSITLAFIWGAIVMTLAAVFLAGYRKSFIPEMTDRLWIIVLLAIIPLILQEFSRGIILGMNAVRKLGLTLLGRDLFLLFLVLLVIKSGEYSAVKFASIWLIVAAMGSSLLLIQTIRIVGESPFVDPGLIRQMVKVGLQSHRLHLFSLLRLRFDPLLLALFLTSSDIGTYSIALAMVAFLWYLPLLPGQILLPYLAEYGAEMGHDLTALFTRLGFAIVSGAGILLGLFGHWFIMLLPGQDYYPAYQAFILMLPGAVIYSLATILSCDFFGREVHRYGAIISFGVFVLNLVAAILLIPRFGIGGAAAASSVTNCLVGLMYLHSFMAESGMRIGELLIPKKADLQLLFRRSF